MNTKHRESQARGTKTREMRIGDDGMDGLAIVILAAGKGSRMKSDIPKVLHKIAGKSMVAHVLACAEKITPDNIYLVVGHGAELVKEEVGACFSVNFVTQKQLLGTGDAVKQALPALASGIKDVLVLCGDVPLIRQETLVKLVTTHRSTQAKLTVLAVDMENPDGYGRIVLDSSGQMMAIREESDATISEKQITTINTGIYCFDRGFIEQAIDLIRPDNSQAEFYLTDMVEIARSKGEKISVRTMTDPRQVIGVNNLNDLENAESLIPHFQNELP